MPKIKLSEQTRSSGFYPVLWKSEVRNGINCGYNAFSDVIQTKLLLEDTRFHQDRYENTLYEETYRSGVKISMINQINVRIHQIIVKTMKINEEVRIIAKCLCKLSPHAPFQWIYYPVDFLGLARTVLEQRI